MKKDNRLEVDLEHQLLLETLEKKNPKLRAMDIKNLSYAIGPEGKKYNLNGIYDYANLALMIVLSNSGKTEQYYTMILGNSLFLTEEGQKYFTSQLDIRDNYCRSSNVFLSRLEGTSLDITKANGKGNFIINRKEPEISHVVLNCFESLGSHEDVPVRDTAVLGSRAIVRTDEKGKASKDLYDEMSNRAQYELVKPVISDLQSVDDEYKRFVKKIVD